MIQKLNLHVLSLTIRVKNMDIVIERRYETFSLTAKKAAIRAIVI